MSFVPTILLINSIFSFSEMQLDKDGEGEHEGESEEDIVGNAPCIDNGKASRGHTRCVKCGHSKNPSAKLQCVHCGAYLRDQTKARVAQRWAMLKEKAKREGRLGDKVRALFQANSSSPLKKISLHVPYISVLYWAALSYTIIIWACYFELLELFVGLFFSDKNTMSCAGMAKEKEVCI